MAIENNGILSKFNEENNDIALSLKSLDPGNKKVIVGFQGYIDTYNSPKISEFVNKLLEKETSISLLVFDLSGLSYISSTGIGFLTESLSICNNKKIKFYLSNIQKSVIEVINLLGFSSFFNIIEDINSTKDLIIEESKFPISVVCSKCGKPLKIIKAGKFKCSSCDNIIKVNEKGEIE